MYLSKKKQSATESGKGIFQFCPKVKRKRFTPDEDGKIITLLQEMGKEDWVEIARQIPGRTPRQCKERWRNYLNPQGKCKFTRDEDLLLYQKHQEFGSKWGKIGVYFPEKTVDQLKNRYKSVVRHMLTKPAPDKLEYYQATYSTTCAVSIIDTGDYIFQSGGGLHAEEKAMNFLEDFTELEEGSSVRQVVLTVSKSPCSSTFGTNPGESGCQEKLGRFINGQHGLDISVALVKLYQPHNKGSKEKSLNALEAFPTAYFECIR